MVASKYGDAAHEGEVLRRDAYAQRGMTRDTPADNRAWVVHSRLLANLAAEFSQQPDLLALFQVVARRATEALGDWCAIELIEPGNPHLTFAAVYHRDPEKVRRIREVLARHPIARDDPLVQHVFGAHRPVALSLDDPHLRDLLLRVPAIVEAFTQLGLARAMTIPMYERGNALGVLSLGAEVSGQWDEDDLRLASLIADLAAIAIQNARLFEAEQASRRAAERAADRTARLQAVTAALSEAVTPSEVLDVMLDHGAAALGASAGFVALLVDDGSALEIVRARGYPEASESVGARRPMSVSLPSTEAARMRTPIFLHSREEGLGRYPGLATFRSGLPGGARCVLPLAAGARSIGALLFAFPASRVFEEGDRALMMAFARQCTLALERARLYARERQVADTLQRAFLPSALPEVPGLTIRAAYQPAANDTEVGGDWYDAFRLPDGRIVLSVGDVVGHGLQAAVVMGQVRQTIRAAAVEAHGPGEMLRQASRVLKLTYAAEGMATALVAVLDPAASALTYAAAGHPGPALGVPGGRVEVLASGGLPLGAMGLDTPEERTISLPPGSLLVLYTDGLVESTRDFAAGEAALVSAVREEVARPPGDAAHAILQHVLGGRHAPDDVALITVALATAPLDRLDITLPAEPASLALVRQALARLCMARRVEEDRALGLIVATGEAVNNVVEHAYGARSGTVSVRARVEADMLRVEVQDRGCWRTPRTQERGGFGRDIMRALVDAAEWETTPEGTRVRLMLRLAGPSLSVPASQVPGEPATRETPPGEAAITGTYGADHEPAARGAVTRLDEGVPGGTPRHGPGRFDLRQADGLPVIEAAGDIDLTSVDAFRGALQDAASQGQAVVVSLAGVSYLDSHAVHTLLSFGRRVGTGRGALILIVPRRSALRKIVDAAGLGRAFALAESVDEAAAVARAFMRRTSSPPRSTPRRSR
jgi:anti-anti-sigma factor